MDYDKNPIQNYTLVSYEEMKAFQMIHYRVTKLTYLLLLIICIIMSIFLRSHPLFFMFFSVSVFCAYMFLYFNLFYTEKKHESHSKLMKNGQHYSFFQHDFTIGTENSDYVEDSRCAYNILENIIETDDMFYLYINESQAYLVSKNGFQTGSPDEFRSLLQNHIPLNKYKIIKPFQFRS